MENMTKEPIHLKLYNWRTLCGSTGEGLRGSFLITDVTCQECLRISSSGSVAAPKEEERQATEYMKHQKLYDEIVMLDNGMDFLLAVNSGISRMKELEEAIKELLPIAENELHQSTCVGYSYTKLKAIIDRARKLISK